MAPMATTLSSVRSGGLLLRSIIREFKFRGIQPHARDWMYLSTTQTSVVGGGMRSSLSSLEDRPNFKEEPSPDRAEQQRPEHPEVKIADSIRFVRAELQIPEHLELNAPRPTGRRSSLEDRPNFKEEPSPDRAEQQRPDHPEVKIADSIRFVSDGMNLPTTQTSVDGVGVLYVSAAASVGCLLLLVFSHT